MRRPIGCSPRRNNSPSPANRPGEITLTATLVELPSSSSRALARLRRRALSEHNVASVRVSRTLEGLRIAHLSDVHVRTGIRPRFLERAVELVNSLKPDLVALTGDYVCHSPRPLPGLTRALKGLHAPAYATLGNHDHWSGASLVIRALEQAGVDVLVNEHRVIPTRTGKLHLVGVDDSVTNNHDPEKSFAGVPSDATSVVLSHDPKSADFLHRYNPALILSGHTHGGQIFVKGVTPYLMKRLGRARYLHGFFEVNGSVLFVNRGLGGTVPIRFQMPTEVAVLTLRSSEALEIEPVAA